MIYVDRIKSWLPNHFKTPQYDAYIGALSDAMQLFRDQVDDLFDETFITTANSQFLDILGAERNLYRTGSGASSEPDRFFSNRIRRIKYNRTKRNIILNSRSVSRVDDISVINDLDSDFLAGEEDKLDNIVTIDNLVFGNYGPLSLRKRHNCFSVIIRTPVPDLNNFLDDEGFFDDNIYADDENLFQEGLIQELKFLIKQKIPAGAGFRLLVHEFGGVTIGDEASQEDDLNSI